MKAKDVLDKGVAKVFNQVDGIDYKETSPPVIKPQTMRLVLALALSKNGSSSSYILITHFLIVTFKKLFICYDLLGLRMVSNQDLCARSMRLFMGSSKLLNHYTKN